MTERELINEHVRKIQYTHSRESAALMRRGCGEDTAKVLASFNDTSWSDGQACDAFAKIYAWYQQSHGKLRAAIDKLFSSSDINCGLGKIALLYDLSEFVEDAAERDLSISLGSAFTWGRDPRSKGLNRFEPA